MLPDWFSEVVPIGKDNLQNGRKYLQIIHLIRDVYLEYIKNTTAQK